MSADVGVVYVGVVLFSHMGLGKTLQSLCIVAGDHHNRTNEYKVRQYQYSDSSTKSAFAQLLQG